MQVARGAANSRQEEGFSGMLNKAYERAAAQKLARNLLVKSVADTQSIAATNPALVHEWLGELRAAREQTLREARLFQEAIELLCSDRSSQVRDVAA
jgi:hypothetical protein